jgi:hypothetical protein
MVQETVAGERVTICEVCRRLIKLGLIKGPE